ncbi:MAG: hypothetical protein K6F76_05420 [Clostridiales bacterium]|nr:hypothetical protein [Clostridiales bacterium]
MTKHYEYDAEKEIQSLNNQEHTKEAKKKPKSGKLAVVFACMALVCAIAVAVAAICFIGNSSQKVEALSKQIEILAASVDTNTETQENGVTIAGQYEIKPTEAISDAYKSGDSSKLDKKQKETLKMASEVLSEIITDKMSDFEKETAVYDWMTSSLQNDTGMLVVVPATQQDCENPYGVLKYHNAVCVGYATTFRLFMQMLDLDCMVVHNNDLYHSWDLVNIDDNWYHVDIYSDAGMGGYQHFNLNDDMMLAQQNWDTSYFPAADSLELNKYYMSRIAVDDIYDVPAKMREEIDKKSSFVCFEFTKELSNEDMAVVQSFMDVLSNCLSNSYVEDFAFSVTQNSWTTDSKTGHSMVSATFDYNSDDNYAENYEIDYDKIGEILSDSFGDVLPDIKDYSNGNYGYDYNDDYYNDGNYGY